MSLLFECEPCDVEVVPLVFGELAAKWSEPVPQQPAPNAAWLAREEAEARHAAELEEVSESARHEAEQAFAVRLHESLEIERSAVTHTCASFAQARDRYFAEVESEVVKLSLAIAARVLQREAAFDPLLLQGVVRVALRKLEHAEGTVLHIPADDAERWRVAMRVVPSLRIESDSTMATGDCRLESPGGVAELGIAAQLAEVERGFFDLMARRPA